MANNRIGGVQPQSPTRHPHKMRSGTMTDKQKYGNEIFKKLAQW